MFSASAPAAKFSAKALGAIADAGMALDAAAVSTGAIQLTWSSSLTGQTGFELLRRNGNSGPYKEVAAVGTDVTTFTDAGLKPNKKYSYEVVALNGPAGIASVNAVASTLPIPSAPSKVKATAASNDIQLTWSESSPGVTGFNILQAVPRSNKWTLVTTVSGDATSYDVTDLQPNSVYRYRVQALTGQDASKLSAVASAKTSLLNVQALSADSVQLAWTAPSAAVTGFQVQRKPVGGGDWSVIATISKSQTTSFASDPSLAGYSYGYTDSDLQAGTGYIYQLVPLKGPKKAAVSSPTVATVQTSPAAPTGLSATAVSVSSIQLAWSDTSSSETGFEIQRRTLATDAWTTIATVANSAASFTDSNLQPGSQYSYQVLALNSDTASAASDTATATTLPSAPGPLSAVAVSVSDVQLSWSDPSSNETGFEIQRQVVGTDAWTTLATVDQSTTTFTDSGLIPGTGYSYQVIALNTAQSSAPSTPLNVTTLPAAPENVAATATSANDVQLTWSAGAGNQTGFEVLRQDNVTGAWNAVAVLDASVTSYEDSGLQGSTQYTYEVVALSGTTTSAPSQVASTTLTAPTAATGLTATVQTASKIQLNWADSANDETGFKIARSTDGVHFTTVATVGANTTSYVDFGLTPATAYQYLVVATNAVGDSIPSGLVNSTTAAEILPGSGWTGATAQPPAQGTPDQFGYNDEAIARWDVVPFQTFSGELNVGVVAFANSGIDHVAFSVDGGTWANVSAARLNPQTENHTGIGNRNDGAVEYWATLNGADFRDGQIEVRAIVYPKVGQPRVLQGAMGTATSTAVSNGNESLYLTADAGGSLATGNMIHVSQSNGLDTNDGSSAHPVQTILRAISMVVNGGTIQIDSPGAYPVGTPSTYKSNTQWITIQAAPGLTPDQVVISQNTRSIVRPEIAKLKWLGISFDFNTISQIYPELGGYAWFDQCVWYNSAGWAAVYSPTQLQPVRSSSFIGGSFVTNSYDHDFRWGFLDQSLVRGSGLFRISDHAFTNNQLVLNSSVDTMAITITGVHADLFHYYGTSTNPLIDNTIIYGVTATDLSGIQDIFLDHTNSAFSNMAFVNITARNVAPINPPFSQLYNSETNILFKHVVIPDQSLAFQTNVAAPNQAESLVPVDVWLDGTQFYNFLTAPPPGVTVQ